MKNTRTTSSTVEKAFAILDMLSAKGGDGISLSEVSAQLQISKSTAHRYLVTFEKLTVVERDKDNLFYPGLKLVELAGGTLESMDLISRSKPVMHGLVERFGETVNLAVPSGIEVVYVAKVESAQSLRMASRLGTRMPLSTTSLGKSILAHLPPHRLDEVLAAGLPARTTNSITKPGDLFAELEQVRCQGFAIDDQENVLGVRCVGAPLFDYRSEVVGAISVAGPAQRLSSDKCQRIGPAVSEAASHLSKGMGYPR